MLYMRRVEDNVEERRKVDAGVKAAYELSSAGGGSVRSGELCSCCSHWRVGVVFKGLQALARVRVPYSSVIRIRNSSCLAHARTLTHPRFPSRPSRPLDPNPPSIRPPNGLAGPSKRPHAARPTISRSRRTSHWQGNRLLAKRLRIVQALYGPRAGGAAHTLPAGRSTSTSMVPPRLLQVRRWARGSDAGVSVCRPTPSRRTTHPAISTSR